MVVVQHQASASPILQKNLQISISTEARILGGGMGIWVLPSPPFHPSPTGRVSGILTKSKIKKGGGM